MLTLNRFTLQETIIWLASASLCWCLEPWLIVLCVYYGGQIIKLEMNGSFGKQTVPFSTVKKWIKFWNHQIQTILRLHFTGRIGGMSVSEMLRVMCRLQDTICNLCNVRHCDLWFPLSLENVNILLFLQMDTVPQSLGLISSKYINNLYFLNMIKEKVYLE